MSYSVQVYQVRQTRLDETLGSGNLALLDRLSSHDRLRFLRHDEHFADELAAGDPPLETALRHLITGESTQVEIAGYAYGYAFEVLCGLIGLQLPSNSFQAMSLSWLDTVDDCLEQLGAPKGLRTNALVDGYAPGFPVPGDFPGTGRWTAAVITTGQTWFSAQDVTAEVDDYQLVDALHEIEDWLRRCGDDEMLVGVLA